MSDDPDVDLIAETLGWHVTRLVRVRHRLRTVGWRYECLCGWRTGLFRRGEHNSQATKRRAARQHVAEQVAEALRHCVPEVVDAAPLVCAEPASSPHDRDQGHGGDS